jgi:hypothetical protein
MEQSQNVVRAMSTTRVAAACPVSTSTAANASTLAMSISCGHTTTGIPSRRQTPNPEGSAVPTRFLLAFQAKEAAHIWVHYGMGQPPLAGSTT